MVQKAELPGLNPDSEPDKKVEKAPATPPNFLGKLWKSQLSAGSSENSNSELNAPVDQSGQKSSSTPPSAITAGFGPGAPIKPLTANTDEKIAGSKASASVEPMNGIPGESTTDSSAKSSTSSQFLNKLWKAQKTSTPGSSDEATVEPLDTSNSQWLAATNSPIKRSSPIEVVESTPQPPQPDTSVEECAAFEQSAIVEQSMVPDESLTSSKEESDAINSAACEDENELAPVTEISPEHSPAVIEARKKMEAQEKRKVAVEAYEKMKEEQRLKTERSKTLRADPSLFASLSHDENSTAGDTTAEESDNGLLSRQSFNSAVAAAPKDAPRVHRETGARKVYEKHPMLVVLGVAVVAAAIVYFPTGNAQSNLRDAEARLARGDAAGALPLLDKAVHSNPRLEDALVARARAHAMTGAYDLALADCNQAVDLHSGQITPYLERAIVEFPIGRFRPAIADMEMVARIQGTLSPEQLMILGKACFGDGQYSRAITQFSKTLDRKPGDIDAILGQAKCYQAMSQPHRAIDACNQALGISQNSYDALVLKGQSEGELPDSQKEAITDFEKAIALQEARPEAFIQRGLLYATANDFVRALNDLDNAVKLSGASPDARYQLAMIHALNGSKEKALEQFKFVQSGQKFKMNNMFLIHRSDVYVQLKDYAHAIADLQAAQSNDRSYMTSSWIRLAKCFAAMKNYKQAAAFAARVLADEPSNTLALIKHSEYSLLSGNRMTALSDLFKAIDSDPRNATAYAERGDMYVTDKQFNLAATDFQKASELSPGNQTYKSKLALCTKRTRQTRMVSQPDRPTPALSSTAQAEIASASLETLKSKGYQALKSNNVEYATNALTRAVFLNKNDANARRYLAYALLKAGDFNESVEQFYAWENIANPDASSELTFARSLAAVYDAQNLFEHLAERYRTNAAVLYEIAKLCQFYNYPAIATSALDFGTKVASSDELIRFNRLRIEIQQSSAGTRTNSAPAAVSGGKPVKVEN